MVYFPPENSTCNTVDMFTTLLEEVSSLPQNVDKIICGDFNPRTSNLPDFFANVYHQGSDGVLWPQLQTNADILSDKVFQSYLRDTGRLDRVSEDNARPNYCGKQLLSFCKTSNLFIMNGRVGHDRGVGGFTRIDTTGKSVVDYLLTTPPTFAMIRDFCIHNKVPESDISFSMAYKGESENKSRSEECTTWHSHYKYMWDKSSLQNLMPTLKDDISSKYCECYKASIVNLDNTNDVASKFSTYFNQACQRLFDGKSTKVNRHNHTRPWWFDAKCRAKRTEAIKAGERVITKDDETNLLQSCREYRAIKQKKQRIFEQSCIQKIKDTFRTNRSNLWKILNILPVQITQTCLVMTTFIVILEAWHSVSLILILITITNRMLFDT